MGRYWRFVLGLVLTWFWAWFFATPGYADHTELSQQIGEDKQVAVTLPRNFIIRTVVSGLTLPTDMVILPSGDFLVTEKGTGSKTFSKAQVRLVRGEVLQPKPVLTLSVNSEEDSGLLGIVLDPNFASNGYFYLWYSTGEESLGWSGTSVNRLSRFVYNAATGTADPASETIILDNVKWAPIHNGGGLAFDDQGNLLITTGDAGSNYISPLNHLSQSLFSLNGKVLRIRPLEQGGYAIPNDNPYAGNIEGIRSEIYAMGLRNPFRIVRRAADQQFYLLDVGQDTWEEVNRLAAKANYGWPEREGKCELFQRENCTPTPPPFTDPVLTYIHPQDLGAGITGIAFYEGTQWPPQYRGRVFVADFDSDWIKMADLNQTNPSLANFAANLGAVVDIEATDAGLYILSIYDQSIKFIYYDEESNFPPTVQWSATAISGTAPLRVTFTAVAHDPDEDDLTYFWDFGDGVTTTTEIPTVSYVYTADGDYLATLQVIDEDDGKSEILTQLIQVYSGARATIIQENLTQPGRTLYQGGDRFRFRAVRAGGTTGLVQDEPYAWTILLHHNDHAHILLAEYISSEVELEIPIESHAIGVPLWYEVRLTMRTESGQAIPTTIALMPQTTTIQVQSWPGPTTILLDKQPQKPDELTLVVVGQEHELEAPHYIVHNGKIGVFMNWVVIPSWPVSSEAGETVIVTERRFTLVAPPEANTYMAFYEYIGTATSIYLPDVSK